MKSVVPVLIILATSDAIYGEFISKEKATPRKYAFTGYPVVAHAVVFCLSPCLVASWVVLLYVILEEIFINVFIMIDLLSERKKYKDEEVRYYLKKILLPKLA